MIFIAVMLIVMLVILGILGRQNQKVANTFIQNAFNIVRYTMSERQEKLLFDSEKMTSMENLGRKIKYVIESSSYFKYDTLRPTYMKMVGVLYSTSVTAGLWKAEIYNMDGNLMAFAMNNEDGYILGCVHNREIFEIASLESNEELMDESWSRQDALPAGIECGFNKEDFPNKEEIIYQIIDNSLCLVAYVPIMGKDYNPVTEKMEEKQAGVIVASQKLDHTFAMKMTELTGTDINIFTPDGILCSDSCCGNYDGYDKFNFSGFKDITGEWSLAGQPVIFGDVDIAEHGYFQGVLPIYSDSKCVAVIVSLYSKAMARANTMQIIKLLSLVYLVGIMLIVPITILVVVRGIINPIERTAFMMRQIAREKDFTKMLDIESHNEIGDLASSFNEMTEDLRKTTTSVDNLNREINERMKAEKYQAQLFGQLEKTNQELKDFAYVISHDLKAPLRGIQTLANWISDDYADKLGDEGRKKLALLARRVERMHNLIGGILQYSRIGRLNEEETMVNLNELVGGIIEMLAPPENVSVTIERELPTIPCEKTRISQVFQNLISNAIKYMDKENGRIEIDYTDEDDFWRFSVADNGPGIEEKYFEKIFQMFQTLIARDEFESTGIGLTLVKKIVDMHNGRIWVESKIGIGSIFFFTLPKQKKEMKNAKLETNIAC